MNDLDSKREQFNRRLDVLARQRKERMSPADQQADAGVKLGELESRLFAWEALLDQRLAEYRGVEVEVSSPAADVDTVFIEPVPEVKPPRGRPFSHRDAALYTWLEDLEEMMLGELELGRHPLPAGLQAAVQVVQSDAEMREAIAAACGWNDPDSLPLDGHYLGAFHVPGKGTLLNHAHYEREHGLRELGQGAPEVCAHVVGEVALERWGWGYLLEYTTLGQRAGEAGLWPALCSRGLGLPVQEPQSAATAAALRQAWLLLEAGWQDWVWQYVMFKARHPVGARLFHRPRPGRLIELIGRIVDLFPLYLAPFGVRIRLRNLIDLVRFLFLEESEVVPASLHQVMRATQAFCLESDGKISELIQQPLSLVLGRLYFARLEARAGILATPYAVLIAAHVLSLALDGENSPEQMIQKIDQDPYLNPDTRLAMLANLDPRIKYDPKAMFTAAWERLRLDGPREYFD